MFDSRADFVFRLARREGYTRGVRARLATVASGTTAANQQRVDVVYRYVFFCVVYQSEASSSGGSVGASRAARVWYDRFAFILSVVVFPAALWFLVPIQLSTGFAP